MVVDRIQREELGTPVAFYFFDFSNEAKQTAHGFMHSVALQLCEQSAVLNKSITSLYERCRGGPCDFHGLQEAIGLIIKDFSKAYVIVDALDECLLEEGERGKVVLCLEHIQSVAANTRLFVSSRPEYDVALDMEKIRATNIKMQHSVVDGDIGIFVRSQLSKEKGLRTWDQQVKGEIEKQITSKAQGM